MKKNIRKIIRKTINEHFEILEEGRESNFIVKMRNIVAKEGSMEKYSQLTKLKGWPLVPDSDGEEGSVGTLDLENNEFYSVDNKKFVLITGGDWQDAHVVELGLRSGEIVVINWRKAERGEYKEKNRMKSKNILSKLYEKHEFHNDEKSFLKYVKQTLKKGTKPSSNYYENDSSYSDPVVVEGPKVEDDSVYIIWDSPGHAQKSEEKKEDDFRSQEEWVEKRFEGWLKKMAWYGTNGKVRIGKEDRNIGYEVEYPGEDLIKFKVWIKNKKGAK